MIVTEWVSRLLTDDASELTKATSNCARILGAFSVDAHVIMYTIMLTGSSITIISVRN